MSKKFIITESERKNILSYYFNKNIITESKVQTENLNLDFRFFISSFWNDSLYINLYNNGIYFWPYLDIQKTNSSLTAKMRVYVNENEAKESSKKFLEEVGLSEKYPNGMVGDVIVQFEKLPESEWNEEQNEKSVTFFKRLSADFSDDENKPFIVLIKNLVQGEDKFVTFSSIEDSFDCSGKITSVSIEIPDETEQEEPASAPEEKKNETTPDNVGDSGLPEGEFEDEVLTKGKTKKPSWLKRSLTREKTELMNNLKSLEGKLIEVGDMVFKISDVKVSSDIQGVLIFSCNQQRINTDLVNKPKFKFVGKKDFYFACKFDQGSSIFYDSAQYVYNRQDNIYYGNSMDEIRNKTNYLEEFVFDNICKFINPKK